VLWAASYDSPARHAVLSAFNATTLQPLPFLPPLPPGAYVGTLAILDGDFFVAGQVSLPNLPPPMAQRGLFAGFDRDGIQE